MRRVVIAGGGATAVAAVLVPGTEVVTGSGAAAGVRGGMPGAAAGRENGDHEHERDHREDQDQCPTGETDTNPTAVLVGVIIGALFALNIPGHINSEVQSAVDKIFSGGGSSGSKSG